MKTNLGLVVGRPGLVRDGLQAVLSAAAGIDVVEFADDGASALDRLEYTRPDVVILDSSLPQDELCTTLRQMQEQWPDVRCIVIADSPRQQGAMEAAGADATLVEGFSAELLTAAITGSPGPIRPGRKNKASG